MKTRNILSLLLLLTVSLAACQAAPTDPIDDNVTSGDTSSTESTADDTLPPPDYTNDYDGRGFTIVTTSQLQYIYADEMNGSGLPTTGNQPMTMATGTSSQAVLSASFCPRMVPREEKPTFTPTRKSTRPT